MRVSLFYFLITFCSIQLLLASVPASSQSLIDSMYVEVEMNDEPIANLFTKISSNSRARFAFNENHLLPYQHISLPNGRRTVRQTLELALNQTGLTYFERGTMIGITLKEEQQPAVRGPVTGVVKDKAGNPLPGVSIFIKGTSTGTTTDAEGRYSIDLPAGASAEAGEGVVLVFSFIGTKTQEVTVNGRTIIDIIMEEDTSILDEVVINGGYYETTDKLKTGSIVKVTAKDIERQPVTSPLMALQGRVTGLEITPNDGTPGNAPVVRIRGNNSLRIIGKGSIINGNLPLYVIDGVPVNSTPLENVTNYAMRGGSDPLSTINPDNIASIEILKDADATAIYGSRGANGVILITTKRPKRDNDKTNVDLKFYQGIGKIPSKIDILNTKQFVAFKRESLKNEGLPITESAYELTRWDTTRYTDWQDVLLGGTSNITDIQGGLSSGNKNTTINFGVGYHRETLVTPGDFGYQRGVGNISFVHNSPNQKFSSLITLNYGVELNKLFLGDFVGEALRLAPHAPALYDANGNLNWGIYNIGGISQSTWDNPIAITRQTSTITSKNLNANGNLSYKLFPNLSVSVSFGISDLASSNKLKTPVSSLRPELAPYGGSASFTDNKRSSWIIEPKTSFAKRWNDQAIDIIIGTTWQQGTTHYTFLNGRQYSSDALLNSIKGAGIISVIADEFSEYKYISLYGRAGYNFKEKYLVNLTARRDGSSRFGPNNRFGNFGAIGAAWIFTGESFIKQSIPFLTFGKVRGSYGITGGDNIGDYSYLNLYDVKSTNYQGVVGFVPYTLYNPKFAWEVTHKLETALEISFLDNRVSSEVSWYRNRSSNQLVNYPLSAITGFGSVLQNFEAVIQNTGWEIVLRGDMLSSNDWRWNASVNFTLPNNKLLRFDGLENSPYNTFYKIGEPLSIQWLYTYKGVNPETGVYEFLDKNGDGDITYLDKSLVNATDKSFYGGFSNSIQYKGFELSLLFQFTKTKSLRYLPGTTGNQPVSVLKRWQNPNDRSAIQKFGSSTELSQSYFLLTESTANIIDASFIRLKTMSLTYQFPIGLLDKLRLQQARVFVQGQNLLTLTNYKDGFDPETGSSLPPLRMLTIGVQLTL